RADTYGFHPGRADQVERLLEGELLEEHGEYSDLHGITSRGDSVARAGQGRQVEKGRRQSRVWVEWPSARDGAPGEGRDGGGRLVRGERAGTGATPGGRAGAR